MQSISEMVRKGTDGRVYGGDEQLVHIKDGTRAEMGAEIALALDQMMRAEALANGLRSSKEAEIQPLCPGCYMVAMYDAILALAKTNGQDLRELGRTMAAKFSELARTGDGEWIEHIDVVPPSPIELLFPYAESI